MFAACFPNSSTGHAGRRSLVRPYRRRERLHRAISCWLCGTRHADGAGPVDPEVKRNVKRVGKQEAASDEPAAPSWCLGAGCSRRGTAKGGKSSVTRSDTGMSEVWKSLCRGLCVCFNRQPNAFCYYLQLGMSVPYAECVLTATKGRQAVAVKNTVQYLSSRLFPLIMQSKRSLPNCWCQQYSRKV